jgi:hypothetical protein
MMQTSGSSTSNSDSSGGGRLLSMEESNQYAIRNDSGLFCANVGADGATLQCSTESVGNCCGTIPFCCATPSQTCWMDEQGNVQSKCGSKVRDSDDDDNDDDNDDKDPVTGKHESVDLVMRNHNNIVDTSFHTKLPPPIKPTVRALDPHDAQNNGWGEVNEEREEDDNVVEHEDDPERTQDEGGARAEDIEDDSIEHDEHHEHEEHDEHHEEQEEQEEQEHE